MRSASPRIASIDIVRGLVMVIMALDHVRELMHTTALTQSPTDLAVTTPELFFTRWITHLCAPIFVFLSGTSAYLSLQRSDDGSASRRFFMTRGIWLFFLEFTVIGFGIWFDVHFQVFLFQVIAAIGLALIIIGLLLPLGARWIGALGLLIVVFHQLVPQIPVPEGSVIRSIINFLFTPGMFPLGSDTKLVLGYPPVPWIGIGLLGFGAGTMFTHPKESRIRQFLVYGFGSLLIFVLLRAGNLYGDPTAWDTQRDATFTILSFLNVTKYPPSLQFDLLMLGCMWLLLAIAEHWENRKPAAILGVYGRVPLFYYLIHWYVIHLTLFALLLLQGFSVSDFRFGFNFGRPEGESGVGLGGVYAIWIGVVALLYPLCRWYDRYKQTHKHRSWVRYL